MDNMSTPDLKLNCLICRSSVKNYQNTGFHIPWIEDVTMSLCEVLPLDRYLQPVLETAVYCEPCLFIIRDIDFTQKSVSALQRRLEDARGRIVSLLGNNAAEVGCTGEGESIFGSLDMDEDYSYEQVLKSVWESASTEKKLDTNGNGSPVPHRSVRARPGRPFRHRIFYQPQELSDDDSESDSSPETERVGAGNGATSRRSMRKRKKSTGAPQTTSKKSKTQGKADLKTTGKKNGTQSKKPKTNENAQPRTKEDTGMASHSVGAAAGQRRTKTEDEHNASLPLFRCGCGAAFATRNHLKGHRRTACLITHPDGIKPEAQTETEEGGEDGAENDDNDAEEVPKKEKTDSTNKKKYSTKKKFICTVEGCQFRCDNEGRFQVHNRKHEGDETPYHCDLCNAVKFASQRLLYDHRRRHCPVTANTRRNTVRKSTRTPRESTKRFRLESETEDDSADESKTEDVPKFTCSYEGCTYSTASERRYQCHIRIHEGDPLPYWCKLCTMKFPKAKHLNLHNHRNCGDVVECPIPNCGSVFPTKFAVSAHLNTVHIKEGKVECKFCSKIFDRSEDAEYNEHIGTHQVREAESRKFSCILGDCAASFTNSIDLKAHVLDKHESSTTKCDICEAILANPISLKRHMLEMHAPRRNDLQCSQCTYIGNSKSGLAIHMNRHTETKQFACTVEGCGNTFRWPSGLRTHMMIHAGLRKYKCTFENCTKSFITSAKLKDHEETHNDRRTYFCDRCAKTFKAKKNLEQHFRYMHRGVKVIQKPRPKKPTETQTERKPRTRKERPVPKQEDQMNTTLPAENVDYNSPDTITSNEIDLSLGSTTWTLAHPQYVGLLNPLIYPDGTTTLYFQ